MTTPKTKQGTRLGTIALVIVAILWLALFFSGRGVLVWFTEPPQKVGMLKCQYFTGTGVVERQFLFSKQGFLGRETCPRMVELRK
jgi:hypothetical protein